MTAAIAAAVAIVLPGPATPGATNPTVTQRTITTTICVPGWTSTVRPPTNYTNTLKARQLAARHLPGSPRDYEEDHLIPLALGGNPTNPRNLWPEPWPQARAADVLERGLQRAVCAGRVTLAAARRAITRFKRSHG